MPLPAFGRSRSKSKAAHTAPHRDDRGSRDDRDEPAGAATDSDVDDHELSSYLAALAPETDPESTGSGRRFGEADVHQVRLTPAAGQQLRDLAAERGTSPGALAQEWVLERLAWEDRGATEAAPHDAAPHDARRPGHPRSAPPEPAWPAPEDAFPEDISPEDTAPAPPYPQNPRPAQAPEAPVYGRDDEPTTDEIYVEDLRRWEAQARGGFR